VTGRLVVVSGTGTEIGKTHFAVALLHALAATGARVAGLKPIESGVTEPGRTDAARLSAASSFHVKPFGYAFAEPISPHLAARRAGRAIDLEAIVVRIAEARRELDVLVVELAGGLFTPITGSALNADLARELRADATLLVVPDRLGALHDAVAATRSAAVASLKLAGLVLVAPALDDASTGSNAQDLPHLTSLPLLAVVPRGSVEHLATEVSMVALARHLRESS
jgi:dethiobiotin synthetase